MGTKSDPGPIDAYGNAEPNEPIFVLLARDAVAPQLIRMWADLRAKHGEDAAIVADAREIADSMTAWRDRNRPPIQRSA